MYKIEDIRDIHLEITTKCQARCPMCPRRINGGTINPLMTITEIDLDTFKNWFSENFIRQLDSLFMCGNLGDPIIAQDCLLIFEYLREINPQIRLSMHTNGSARTADFWRRLAELNVRVVFGIDGLSETHKLYRIGTDYYQILRNATTFITAGGHAEWHMLVFEHNQHEVEACRNIANDLGFKDFQIKHTTRFTDVSFPVLDDSGRTLYHLRPSDNTKEQLPIILKYSRDLPLSFMVEQVGKCTINCKAVKWKQIYVAATGNVGPCCWMDFKEKLHKQNTRIDYMDKIGEFPNLHEQTMEEIFSSGYFDKIENTWADDPVYECAKQCGNFDKSGAQFENRS